MQQPAHQIVEGTLLFLPLKEEWVCFTPSQLPDRSLASVSFPLVFALLFLDSSTGFDVSEFLTTFSAFFPYSCHSDWFALIWRPV